MPGGRPPQVPPAQKLPPSQGVQSGSGVASQVPVVGLQMPVEQPPAVSAQTVAVPVQAPAWQLSPLVQRLASSQKVPSRRG